jgi:hypothetical protein
VFYNSQQLRQNTHKNFKNHSQDFTLHSYIQLSRLIALSRVCFVLLSTVAHSTVTGLGHSTPYIHFSFHSSAVSISLHPTVHTRSSLQAAHWLAVTRLSISCCPLALDDLCCVLLIASFEPFSLFQSVLDIPFLHFLPPCRVKSGTLAALTPEASHLAALIGNICYNTCTYSGIH